METLQWPRNIPKSVTSSFVYLVGFLRKTENTTHNLFTFRATHVRTFLSHEFLTNCYRSSCEMMDKYSEETFQCNNTYTLLSLKLSDEQSALQKFNMKYG